MRPLVYALILTFLLGVVLAFTDAFADEASDIVFYDYGYIHKHEHEQGHEYWVPHYMPEWGNDSPDSMERIRDFERQRDATQREHDLYIEMMRLELEQSRQNKYELELLELILENSTEY